MLLFTYFVGVVLSAYLFRVFLEVAGGDLEVKDFVAFVGACLLSWLGAVILLIALVVHQLKKPCKAPYKGDTLPKGVKYLKRILRLK